MLPTRFWADMTWRDFQRVDVSQVIAVLPVAAIEQHGPHLPIGVDAVIHDGCVKLAAEKSPDDLPVLFLPLQPAEVSGEAQRVSRDSVAFRRERDPRLDGNWRQRRPRRLPQARRHQFARRQRRGD
jgi:hypothetical protein